MRFVILFLVISFMVPVVAQVNTQENAGAEKNSYRTVHHESDILQAVFLKDNSEEKNETNHKAIPTAELIDFSFLTTVLTKCHSRSDWHISKRLVKHEPIFRLNCSLLI